MTTTTTTTTRASRMTPRRTARAVQATLLLLGASACSAGQAEVGLGGSPDALFLEAEVLAEVEQVLAPLERGEDAAQPTLAIQAVDSIVPRVEARAVEDELLPGVIWVLQTGFKQAPQPTATWNAALTRGQRVQLVKGSLTETGYVRVVLADGQAGFVLADDVLVGEIEELYAFEASPLFSAPDPKSTPKATLPLGTPLFVLDSQGPFVEVMLPGGERGWMLNTDLARDPDELTAARS